MVVPRDPQTCWRLFTDVSRLVEWVAGLRRVQVITKQRGMPKEVHFEFARSLAYTLVYEYEPERREVRWQPKLGKRDGVTGFARFEICEGGTLLTYGIEHGAGRSDHDRAIGVPQALANALRDWIVAQAP